jgi:DnaK suppressor protein
MSSDFHPEGPGAAISDDSERPSATPVGENETAIAEETADPSGEQPSSTPEAALAEVDELLDRVEHALDALDDGSYGRCGTCGSAIESARLDEDPLERECGSCAAAAL